MKNSTHPLELARDEQVALVEAHRKQWQSALTRPRFAPTLKINPALGYFAPPHLLGQEYGEDTDLLPGSSRASRNGLTHDAWLCRNSRYRAAEMKAVSSARGWFDICEPDLGCSVMFVSDFRPCFLGDLGLVAVVHVFGVAAIRRWHRRGWRGADLARVSKDARALYVVDIRTGAASRLSPRIDRSPA